MDFLRKEYRSKTIYPEKTHIFEAFKRCDFANLKVVIIGQDPYHGPGQAHGLCFSVLRPVRPPPSLKNIYKELHADVGFKMPTHGDLTKWSDQGVFLLNTALTVRKGQANSHKDCGWHKFTDAVIREIGRQKKGVVFLCWGRHAQSKVKIIDRRKHHVITSSHPSPLGATKTKEPFIGSRCFSRTNALLEKQGIEAVDWSLD